MNIKSLIPTITLLAIFTAASWSAQAVEKNEVNVYSYRQSYLVEPLFKDFQKKTGIKVNVVFAKKGLKERLEREGKYSPVDVVLTTDISRLIGLTEKGLAQPVNSHVINKSIPSQFRDSKGEWYALTMRARNIYSTKRNQKPKHINYQDLADSKYKGKICTRSGKHPYNVSLVASVIAHEGEEKAKAWLESVKNNLARRPQGNDRAQVKAIKEGVCDISLGNSYYYGKMLNDEKQKNWAESVYINFPNQSNYGSHVNVSGMIMAKHSPNRNNAKKLMEYLSSNNAQTIFASVNMEYPVNPTAEISDLVKSWGSFQPDSLHISRIAENRSKALQLLDEVRFDI